MASSKASASTRRFEAPRPRFGPLAVADPFPSLAAASSSREVPRRRDDVLRADIFRAEALRGAAARAADDETSDCDSAGGLEAAGASATAAAGASAALASDFAAAFRAAFFRGAAFRVAAFFAAAFFFAGAAFADTSSPGASPSDAEAADFFRAGDFLLAAFFFAGAFFAAAFFAGEAAALLAAVLARAVTNSSSYRSLWCSSLFESVAIRSQSNHGPVGDRASPVDASHGRGLWQCRCRLPRAPTDPSKMSGTHGKDDFVLASQRPAPSAPISDLNRRTGSSLRGPRVHLHRSRLRSRAPKTLSHEPVATTCDRPAVTLAALKMRVRR